MLNGGRARPNGAAHLPRETVLAAFVYVCAAAAHFYNLFPVIGTRIYADPGDPLLNAAILAWNATSVPLTTDVAGLLGYAPRRCSVQAVMPERGANDGKFHQSACEVRDSLESTRRPI